MNISPKMITGLVVIPSLRELQAFPGWEKLSNTTKVGRWASKLISGVALATVAINFVTMLPASASTLTIIHAYNGDFAPGYEPQTRLIQGPDGNFYGLTLGGGSVQAGTPLGVAYQITPAGTITVLHTFDSSDGDGHLPLIFGNDGFLYGTNSFEGISETSGGTVYKLSTTGEFTVLYRFASSGPNGDGPEDGLTLGPDGNLYGTTAQGGKDDVGVVFKITPSGTITKLHDFSNEFDPQTYQDLDGSDPRAGLVLASDGNFYGVTYGGGPRGGGIIFEISPGGDYSIVHAFQQSDAQGDSPHARLVEGSDGRLYGTTESGGTNNLGTIFSCTHGGKFTLLHSFDGNDGQGPDEPLVQASDGFLYGTTPGNGTIFRIAHDGTFQTLHYFDQATEGSYSSGLIQASDGQFYGTLDNDGPQGAGAVYRFTVYPLKLGNISTRINVGTGNNVMIGGFIITGNDPKTVIVRGLGPSLGIAGQLENPTLELHDSSGQLIDSNDDWQNGPDAQAVMNSGIPPSNPKEAAIVRTLNPGAYTAIVAGAGGRTGVGLVEVYDLSTLSVGKLANISTRGVAETGDNVIIVGIIVLGESPAKAAIRAIGPSLATFGVQGTLQDPSLELHDGNGAIIGTNDDWQSGQNLAELQNEGLAPADPRESAILQPFSPGQYTAIVRSKDNTSGVALVEVYNLQ
jgi:uncharacterized repeat protein (TIGR03803 family)